MTHLTLFVETTLAVVIVVIVSISFADVQETSTNGTFRLEHNRTHGHHHRHRLTLNASLDDEHEHLNHTKVELNEGDKYVPDGEEAESSEDDTTDGDEDDKFVETTDNTIVSDHVDFVLLRLKHISMRTSSNITEILAVQKEEMETNSVYEEGWTEAKKIYNESKKAILFNNTSPDSMVRKVPEEYHIALIAYTISEPAVYYYFNKDTRDICSGTDIDGYKWKSFFKLLQLAIETLGTKVERWRDNKRFLYRGASREFALKEGQVLAFQSFISTSAKLNAAEEFAGKSLFEYEGLYNGTAMAIWDHSYYAYEEEVLFSPLQVFRVDSVHVGKHYTRYVLKQHEMALPCDQTTTPGSTFKSSKPSQLDSPLRITTSSSHKTFAHSREALVLGFLYLFIAIFQ